MSFRSFIISAMAALTLTHIGTLAFSAATFDRNVRISDDLLLAQGLNTDAQIVLMRGLGNVFSLGMDDLAKKLEGFGYKPTVANWKFSQAAANEIAVKYQKTQGAPVILIGHSLGAVAAFDIAEILRKRNIPVSYMVTYDLTAARVVPANVKEYVNFYQRNGFGHKASPPPGYKGTMINVDVTNRTDLKHGNIDEGAHEIIMGKVFQVTARQ